jgi:tetratricopeptide (TPR) repeat protein
LATITIAAYAGAFRHDFVSLDDATYVTQNPLVQERAYGALLTTVVNNSYHPLTMLSLGLNASRPLSPRPFIVTNVILHTLDTGLVFWLAFLLSRRRLLVAFVTALLFGIHPMHVESVAWISSRKDVLYVFFFLAGLIAYWRYLEKRSWPWLLLTFVLFVFSCLSKGMAVVFPAILILLDYWKGRPIAERRALLEKAPFFATALLFGLIAVDVEAGRDFHGLFTIVDKQLKALMNTTSFTPFQRVAFPTYGHMMYVWRIFVPAHLCAFYPYPTLAEASHPKYLLSILFFLGTLALTAWSVRRARLLTFGIGWYLLAILPVLQWLPVGASTLADRMTYLAYVGPFFLLATGVSSLFERYRAMVAVLGTGMALVFAVLFALTTRQVETWKNSEALWSNVIRIYPRTDAAYISRGNGRGAAGQIQDAMSDFQTAVGLGSRRADLYDGLGNAYGTLGKPDSALLMFDRALAIDSTLGRTYYNRAIVHLRLGRPREALEDLARALDVIPLQAPTLHFPRGNAFLQLGKYRDAETEFGRAIEAGQMVPDALTNRGVCRLRLNDPAGARSDFREALRLDPNYSLAREQLRALGE